MLRTIQSPRHFPGRLRSRVRILRETLPDDTLEQRGDAGNTMPHVPLFVSDAFDGNSPRGIYGDGRTARHRCARRVLDGDVCRIRPPGYESNVSGRMEVYSAPFARSGDPVRISTAGGRSPRWRGGGGELFFLDSEDRLTSASLTAANSIPVTATERLPTTERIVDFDVSHDGRRFVAILSNPDPAPSTIAVQLNWERLLD